MKKLILLLFILLINTSIKSQNYDMAIGIKSGYPGYGSLNFKKFTGSNNAIDLLFGTSFNDLNKYFWANCLFEYNKNIVNGSGFNWYAGVGPSVGLWTRGGYYHKSKNKTYSGLWGGVSAVVGIEYTIPSIPLNLAVEAGPAINLMPYFIPDGVVNVAIRYVLN
jgi:hypothetical protein